MELTDRQSTILNLLVKEYLDAAEPISSDVLKKKLRLDISPATIRNELQELTEQGYVSQPHISAGRVPTEKAYHYFVEIIFQNNESPNLQKEIEVAKQKIEKELALARELINSLTEISTTLSYTKLSRLQSNRGSTTPTESGQNRYFDSDQDRDAIFEIIKIIGPSQANYSKNIDIIKELLREFENF